MIKADDLGWAKDFVSRNAWVLHVESRVVGKVVALYDGEGKKWVGQIDPRPVQEPVLKLEQGHTFIAKAGSFIELAEKEAQFVSEAQAGLSAIVGAAAQRAGALGVVPQACALLLAAAFAQQLREIERMAKESAAKDPDVVG
jgi:hypothetical protein